jgi:DNA-directed RNA polymerase specialized sigma24 family protein
MPVPDANDPVSAALPERGPEFPTTHWTLVTRVREGGAVRQAALEELCRLYWYPIYAFLRRRGLSPQDAEDFTQGFFLKILAEESFSLADENKGRLRTYLLHHLKRHLFDRNRFDGALKRGGGVSTISFDEMHAEERYTHEPLDERDPESLFTRAWVNELLAGVREKLREDFEDADRPQMFEALLPFLLLDDDLPSYREVASRLRATEVSVRLMVSRLRAKFRDLLREEIARTVEGPEEVAAEMEWLKGVLVKG